MSAWKKAPRPALKELVCQLTADAPISSLLVLTSDKLSNPGLPSPDAAGYLVVSQRPTTDRGEDVSFRPRRTNEVGWPCKSSALRTVCMYYRYAQHYNNTKAPGAAIP